MSETRGYEDEELLSLLAGGADSYEQIGQQLGIAPAMVAAIGQGRQRPELQAPLRQAAADVHARLGRMAAFYGRILLIAQVGQAFRGDTESARKAREFLLDRLLPRGIADEGMPAAPTGPAMPGLTQQDLEYITQRRQGPPG